ncbi:SGNH/GDSL hydrolase family protein [Planctomycetota bacterium]
MLSTRKRLLFTGLTTLAGLLVFLAAGEVYFRATRSHLDLDLLTGRNVYRNPMLAWARVDAFSAYTGVPSTDGGTGSGGKTINSHGFIATPEMTLEKPENTVRIVFLGGSSTAGTGHDLRSERTWPWIATELLRSAVPETRIEFLNGALGGYSSFESLGRLWSRMRFFSPDVIVVYHGWNELYYWNDRLLDNMLLWRTNPDGGWGFHEPVQGVGLYEPLWLDRLISPSQFFSYLRIAVASTPSGELGSADPPASLGDAWDPRGVEVWRQNLRLLDAISGTLGATLFVAKQATLITKDLPEAMRQRCKYELHGFDHDAHVAAYEALYRAIDEEIAPERVIDVSKISGIPEYFHDHVHPTEQGAEKIAEIVARGVTNCVKAQPAR